MGAYSSFCTCISRTLLQGREDVDFIIVTYCSLVVLCYIMMGARVVHSVISYCPIICPLFLPYLLFNTLFAIYFKRYRRVKLQYNTRNALF